MKHIAVIGAGAAGLCAAVTLASKGLCVTLFEQNEQVGKKIIASGNGRCNISNAVVNTSFYYGENPTFARACLKQFDAKKFDTFFAGLGLFITTKSDGKIYPLCNESKAVARIFEKALEHYGVTVLMNAKVEDIETVDDKFRVCLAASTKDERYDALLLSMGSEAAPTLGGNRHGYRLAEKFGHRIISTFPSLVQLQLDSPWHYKMTGVKMVAGVALYIDGKKADTLLGDILFTRYGISGFAVLDISHQASRALLQKKRVFIGLDLLPELNAQSLAASLMKQTEIYSKVSIKRVLEGLLPAKVITPLLKSCSIEDDQNAFSVNQKQFKHIVNRIKEWRFDVIDTHGFKHAEVSGGGISTDEIDETSMESKLQKNLYFAGEMLDITGKRGGYNLHFAWASGYCAAMAMINK